ncbi:patatin-like phospholipase family protein [Candidatus Woesearchaeota archaeon]|nr:patatin-like phospholipase family protein [Candidatus Woesearchaeota archaeon]MCF7900791.1 patatin-like phospholipase family protein [Candidatus Woesearchaeota archaeon]MCF8013093.1 patatin-like phospholipase family protein [Candidatus Woesearchaeota archaeon]
MKTKNKIALVLGGGGFRIYAHLGVIKVLDEMGIKPDYIAAASSGSLIGVLLASGKSYKEIENLLLKNKHLTLLDPVLKFNGLLRGKRKVKKVLNFLKIKTFEELKIPLIINATDINDGKEIVFKKGPLFPAIQASSAFPGIFYPVKLKGKYLVDGGIYSTLPIHLLPKVDTVIAIDISYFYKKIKKSSSFAHILRQSLFFIQKQQVKQEIELELLKNKSRKIILISPKVEAYSLFEFRKKKLIELFKLGEEEARRVLKKNIF